MNQHNWLPYYLRCSINNTFGMKNGSPHRGGKLWGRSNEALRYLHIYKAGGSTIWTGIRKLQEQKLFVTNNTRQYTFTFIRDPISKFLSGFFEVNLRQIIGKNHKKNMT